MNTIKNLKNYIKERDIDTILGHHCSLGMAFMADRISEKELLEDRQICKIEIEKRLNVSISK